MMEWTSCSNVMEVIKTISLNNVEYVSIHCSNGQSYSVEKLEMKTNKEIVNNWPDFLFLAINMTNGKLKIIQKYEEAEIHFHGNNF